MLPDRLLKKILQDTTRHVHTYQRLDEEPLKALRQPGCPWGIRGFASPDCSEFAFI